MLRLAWLVDGWLVYLADWYPMRSCDTVQQIFHSSSSRYAVLYIFVVVVFFVSLGISTKKTKAFPSSDGYGDDDTRCLLFLPSTRPLPQQTPPGTDSMQGVG